MPCLASAALSPTPDSINRCGVWNAPGRQDHLAACANLPGLFALDVFDADRALALEQDAGGLRIGLDPQIGACRHEGMNVAARRTPALAVLLGYLIDSEAFLLGGVEVVADAELGLARGLQIHLPHRIVGLQSGDMQRAAFAVILAVELGVVFRSLEVGQYVVIGPAGIAERSPLVVIALVAADIDHRVDRGRAAEPLAAWLIADPPVETGFCGTVSNAQLLSLPEIIRIIAPGVVTTQLLSLPPASSSATDVPASSESRLATAQPPEPPPTTTKSNVSVTRIPPNLLCYARRCARNDCITT